MLKTKVLGIIKDFVKRMNEDHNAAYATTCAFFVILSFVPFLMIMLAIIRLTPLDGTILMNTIISLVPDGIREYVSTIINEVYAKSFAIVPISVFILVWSASKAFHALTNGLNVIHKVQETRGWWYLRFRSMGFVVLFMAAIVAMGVGAMSLQSIGNSSGESSLLKDIVSFVQPFDSLIGFIVLMLLFLFVYTVLPNKKLTIKSQFPGALLVSLVWVMVSYFVTLYYQHTVNFSNIYGSLTGFVLAMIWLYFCMLFVLFGAQFNKMLAESGDDDNMITATFKDFQAARSIKKEEMEKEIQKQKREATGEIELPKGNTQNLSNTIHDVDEETGIDLSIIRQGVYKHEDELLEEDDE